MRWSGIRIVLVLGLAAAAVVTAAGCGKKLVMSERNVGQIERRPVDAARDEMKELKLDPVTAVLTKGGVEVSIRYADRETLDRFFDKKEVFGKLAGKNPYPPQTFVFYVRVLNRSGTKIQLDPDDFVLIDDINIQYSELSPDALSAIYDARASIWAFAKTTGDLAPGPYGAPLKMASSLGAGSGRTLHYLMKQVRLAPGFLHNGIAYDGYVAFPRPHPDAKALRLIIGNVKANFDPADLPKISIDFEFPFTIIPEDGSSN